MPTYDYQCSNCGHIFEIRQSITAKPKTRMKDPCTQCNKISPIKRLLGSGGAVLFRGSGFYQTDYRSESYKLDAKKDSPKQSQKTQGKSTKSSE